MVLWAEQSSPSLVEENIGLRVPVASRGAPRGCPPSFGELTLPKGVKTFKHIKDQLKCQQTLKEGY